MTASTSGFQDQDAIAKCELNFSGIACGICKDGYYVSGAEGSICEECTWVQQERHLTAWGKTSVILTIKKKIYNIKDYVVYPKHGVGKILAVDKAKIGNIDITFYKVLIEKEKLTLSIPINQQSHLL